MTTSHSSRIGGIFVAALCVASCKTLETGGKVVDVSRKEIVLSSNSDARSALPPGDRDTSIVKAGERLEDDLKANPRNVKSLVNLAEIQVTQNRLDEAEANCRKALLIDLKNTDSKRILAQVAIRRGNFKLAKIFLSSLGGEESKDSSVVNMLGLIAYNQSNYAEAMRLWKAAVNTNSGDISARMNMGIVYLKNRLYQKASTQFERVLKIAPAHQDAKLHLAIVDASRGRYDQAIETYQSILAMDKTNPLALFNLSIAQKNTGAYDDALAGLRQFIKLSQSKSDTTDSAFALMEEINNLKASKGEKISDTELQSLADELATRRSGTKNPKQTANRTQGGAASTNVTQDSKPIVDSNARPGDNTQQKNDANKDVDQVDANAQDIEALERQLNSPAH